MVWVGGVDISRETDCFISFSPSIQGNRLIELIHNPLLFIREISLSYQVANLYRLGLSLYPH